MNAENDLIYEENALKDDQVVLNTIHSIGSLIGSSIWGIIKILLHLVLSGVIGGLVGLFLKSFTKISWLGIVAGIIVGIICMIFFWIKFEDDDAFMDWGMRKETIKKIKLHKARLEKIRKILEDKDKIRSSPEYILAKNIDEMKRKEDLNFAIKWQQDWYNYLLEHPQN